MTATRLSGIPVVRKVEWYYVLLSRTRLLMGTPLNLHKVRGMMESHTLAQIAYRAFGDWNEWKTPQGNRLPMWDELPMNLQNAWTSATETVAVQVRKESLGSRTLQA
jgi:hypothetical protein